MHMRPAHGHQLNTTQSHQPHVQQRRPVTVTSAAAAAAAAAASYGACGSSTHCGNGSGAGPSTSMGIRKSGISSSGMPISMTMGLGTGGRVTTDGHSSVSGDCISAGNNGTNGNDNAMAMGIPGSGIRKNKSKTKLKASTKVSTAEAVRMAAQMDRPPTRRSSKGGWTCEEDDMLRVVVMEHAEKNWKDIACALNRSFPGSNRNDVQCLHRWQKVLQPGLKKGPWTPHEDETITRLVGTLGASKWSLIAKQLPGRIGKQCRERWFNHLNPDINKNPWTDTEERILQEAHAKFGNKWAIIAKYLPGRTDNAIKNHYNATKRRAATRRGRKPKAGSSNAGSSGHTNNINGKTTPSPTLSEVNTSTTTTAAAATAAAEAAAAEAAAAAAAAAAVVSIDSTPDLINSTESDGNGNVGINQSAAEPSTSNAIAQQQTTSGEAGEQSTARTLTTATTTRMASTTDDGTTDEMKATEINLTTDNTETMATNAARLGSRVPPPLNLCGSERVGNSTAHGHGGHHHHHHSAAYSGGGVPLADVTNKAPMTTTGTATAAPVHEHEHEHGLLNSTTAAAAAAIAGGENIAQEKMKEYHNSNTHTHGGMMMGYGNYGMYGTLQQRRLKRLSSPGSAIRRAAKRVKSGNQMNQSHSSPPTPSPRHQHMTDENVDARNMDVSRGGVETPRNQQHSNTLVTTSSHDMDMTLDGTVMSPLGVVGDDGAMMSNFAAYMNDVDLIMTPKGAAIHGSGGVVSVGRSGVGGRDDASGTPVQLDTPVSRGQFSRIMIARDTPTRDTLSRTRGEERDSSDQRSPSMMMTTSATARRLHESSPEFHFQILTPRGGGARHDHDHHGHGSLLDDALVETPQRFLTPARSRLRIEGNSNNSDVGIVGSGDDGNRRDVEMGNNNGSKKKHSDIGNRNQNDDRSAVDPRDENVDITTRKDDRVRLGGTQDNDSTPRRIASTTRTDGNSERFHQSEPSVLTATESERRQEDNAAATTMTSTKIKVENADSKPIPNVDDSSSQGPGDGRVESSDVHANTISKADDRDGQVIPNASHGDGDKHMAAATSMSLSLNDNDDDPDNATKTPTVTRRVYTRNNHDDNNDVININDDNDLSNNNNNANHCPEGGNSLVSTTFTTPPRLLFAGSRGSELRMNVHLSGGIGASPGSAFAHGAGSLGLRSPFLNSSPRGAFTPGVVMMGLGGAGGHQTPATATRSAAGPGTIGKRLMYGLTPRDDHRSGSTGTGTGASLERTKDQQDKEAGAVAGAAGSASGSAGMLPPMFSPPPSSTGHGSAQHQMVTVTGMLQDDGIGGMGMGMGLGMGLGLGGHDEWMTKRQLFACPTPTQVTRSTKRRGTDDDDDDDEDGVGIGADVGADMKRDITMADADEDDRSGGSRNKGGSERKTTETVELEEEVSKEDSEGRTGEGGNDEAGETEAEKQAKGCADIREDSSSKEGAVHLGGRATDHVGENDKKKVNTVGSRDTGGC